jgi:short-subunit dehydrogenase
MSSDGREVVLITGASSGFGKATSELLAEKGYRVFGTSRNKDASMKKIEMLQLDVNSDDSVQNCVKALLERTSGRLDVLVNNAGFAYYGAIEEVSLDDMKEHFETNFFGALRMIKAVLPTMRARKQGKIINIGSIAGYVPFPFEGLYSASKFALEGVSEQLRLETKHLGIKVSVVEPGFFKTNLFGSHKDASESIDDYREVKARAMKRLSRYHDEGGDPAVVAQLVLKIIQEKEPKLHYPIGKEKSALLYKRILPQTTFESGVRRNIGLDKPSGT